MSRDWRRAAPRRPPPKGGIKVKKLGSTWWGQRWLEALERFSREYLSRLGRGRSYARTGRVHGLKVSPGEVRAQVTGSEDEPYEVRIGIDVFTPVEWDLAIAAMATQARFAAELLAGRMPEDIDVVFRSSGRSLFPRKTRDLETDCSCPDWANPCKHVAAVHYVLGEAFDKDPFLLFELRGRSKDQVLEALSRLRSGPLDVEPAEPAAQDEIASVEVRAEDLDRYEQPPAPLPALRFSFDPPQPPAAILRAAGQPAAWSVDVPPHEYFGELYGRAAELARRLADEDETRDES